MAINIELLQDVASIVSEKLSLIRKEQENYEVTPTHGVSVYVNKLINIKFTINIR